jgi:hypothetical protein
MRRRSLAFALFGAVGAALRMISRRFPAQIVAPPDARGVPVGAGQRCEAA